MECISYKNSHDSNVLPHQWTYIYDNTPLGKTLEKYIDFKKLSPNVKKVDDTHNNNANEDNNNSSIPRLIITAVDVTFRSTNNI